MKVSAHWLHALSGSGLLIVAGAAIAQQESLCNPCVDPPIRNMRLDFEATTSTTVITADEMRNLGVTVTSVADIIAQLPQGQADQDSQAESAEDETTPTSTTPAAAADEAAGDQNP